LLVEPFGPGTDSGFGNLGEPLAAMSLPPLSRTATEMVAWCKSIPIYFLAHKGAPFARLAMRMISTYRESWALFVLREMTILCQPCLEFEAIDMRIRSHWGFGQLSLGGSAVQKPYSLAGFSTRIVLRTFASGAHTGSWLNRRPSSIWSSGARSIARRPGTRDESGWGQSVPHRMR
jgi:hypothetical protein